MIKRVLLLLIIPFALMAQQSEPLDIKEARKLYQAIRSGRYKLIEKVLKKGYDINQRDTKDGTLFMAAVGSFDPKMVRMMLKYGPDLDAVYGSPECSFSALSFTISVMDMQGSQDTTILKMLLKAGANANGGDGETSFPPLIWAIIHEQYRSAELLIKYNADVNQKYLGRMTALSKVVDSRNEEEAIALIKLMLGKGLKLEDIDSLIERAENQRKEKLAQLFREEHMKAVKKT